MIPVIEFEECLRDSPKFRATLNEQEQIIELLEQRLEKVLKTCGQMVDSGRNYVSQQSQFIHALWDLSTHFRDDPDVALSLNKIIPALQEMNKFQNILFDQASRTVLKNIQTFIKGDIKNAKESRHYLEKISGDLDGALTKNSQVPKSRPVEAEEAQNILSATRSCFRHTALDHVRVLSLLQARKRHEVLGTLLSYMHAWSTFFHQGSDLTQDLDPFLKDVAENITKLQSEANKLEKEMENRHTLVTAQDCVVNKKLVKDDGSSDEVRELTSSIPSIQGYLFKRTSNAFKTWNRRWFSLQDNQLVYRKRSGEDVTIMEEDLRLCTVKPVVEGDRRFCFEVVSPNKSHILQADSEEMYLAWIEAMQKGIGAAFQRAMSTGDEVGLSGQPSTRSQSAMQVERNVPSKSAGSGISTNHLSLMTSQPPKPKRTRVWEQLINIPGNELCCDCGQEKPGWASINLGITLCIGCSGVHRSLGVHYSKVRSLTLDQWEPEILKVMAELGNAIVNRAYQANVDPDFIRATPNCSSIVRESWIKAKYVERKFVKQLPVSPGDYRSSRPSLCKKWTVRRLRRRPQSRDSRSSRNTLHNSSPIEPGKLKEELDKSSAIGDEGLADDSSDKKSTASGDSEKEKTVNAEVLLFGEKLEKAPVGGSIELSSDEDSTEGEEEKTIGEEDISRLHPDMLLYMAAAAHNLPVMCEAFALQANKNWVNVKDHSRTPLHQAVLSGSVMACEYLLLNGALINCQDSEGKTALHLATEQGHTAQVCLLLKHRADQHLKDSSNQEALDIAVREANADIVTLLRLGLLDEEMKSSDSQGDDTFNNVVRDFSQLAMSHPERLVRPATNRENE